MLIGVVEIVTRDITIFFKIDIRHRGPPMEGLMQLGIFDACCPSDRSIDYFNKYGQFIIMSTPYS